MKLLLVEDERDLSNALSAILKMNGYEVEQVFDGEEGLKSINSKLYDAVILDLMLPKLGGMDVLKSVRESKNNVLIIILSAKGEIDDKVNGLNSGADDYLAKPFSSKELLARIKNILSHKKIDSGEEFKGLVLDNDNLKLIYDKREINLNRKEYDIMRQLMVSQGEIVKKDELMLKVWGFDDYYTSQVAWVNISSIRKKLKEINCPITIKMKRNVGYYLGEDLEND